MALLSDRVREAFKTWDTEGDGTITKTGLKLWLANSAWNIWDFLKKTYIEGPGTFFLPGTGMGTFELSRLPVSETRLSFCNLRIF